MAGKVYLIGAGPGDPGLLTLRGRELIACADVIVYDYLVSEELLEYARPDALIRYVGKKAGDHSMPQGAINELLLEYAGQGKAVARLKGGDPYVFGRGGEEAQELVAAGVAFEVVPGVTAGVAAAAYAGIPVTHRDHTTSVCFITGHEDPTKETSGHSWEVYGKSDSTLVFYMGVGNLPMIADKLLAAGRSPDTPAALVQWGTRCGQRSLVATLETVACKAKEQGFTAPAIIIVGEVCALGDSLGWFEKRPLLGRTVIVTRAREQASDFSGMLRARGACVVEFPTINVTPVADTKPLKAAIEEMPSWDWIIFTSVNGVDCFWSVLEEMGLDLRILAGSQIAAIGPATARRLRKKGIKADFVPPQYVAESVIEGLTARGAGPGTKILIPRAKVAREVLPQALRQAGAQVHVVPVYETSLAETDAGTVLAGLEAGNIDCITFTSSSTVENFFRLVSPEQLRQYEAQGQQVRFASIGPITTKTLQGFGFSAHIEPQAYTIPALTDALTDALSTAP